MRLDDMAHVPKVDAKTFMIYCGLTREGFVIISRIIWNEIWLIAEAVQDSGTRTSLRHSRQPICNQCPSSLFSALKIGVDVHMSVHIDCRYIIKCCDIGHVHVLVPNILAKSGYSSGLNILVE